MGIINSKFHAGLLRSVVNVEINEPTEAESGGEFEAWTQALAGRRGYLRKKNGQRDLEAGEIVLNSAYELVMRFETELENLLLNNTQTRFLCENMIFSMISFTKFEQKGTYYIFQLNESSLG